MKLFCLGLIFICSTGLFAQEGAFVIDGMAKNQQEDSFVYLGYRTAGEEIVDSIKIKDGKFKFDGQVDQPGLSFLLTKKSFDSPFNEDRLAFIIENSKITISINDSLKTASVKGSKTNQDSKELAIKTAPIYASIETIRARYRGGEKDDKFEQAVDSAKVMQAKISKITSDFVKENPDSFLALEYFNMQLGNDFDLEATETQFGKFSPELQSTPLGMETRTKIDIFKSGNGGKGAVNFTQNTPDGTPFAISDLRGKYVLLEFWASWCGPCRLESPELLKIYDKFKGDDFEIVGVSLDSDKKSWVNAIEKDGVNWVQVSDLKGSKNEVAVLYNVSSIPQNFLLDPEGNIIATNIWSDKLSQFLESTFSKTE